MNPGLKTQIAEYFNREIFFINFKMQKINFEKIGFDYIKPGNNSKNLTNRKFVSFYGASPKHVEIIWFDLAKYGWFKNAPAQKVRPVHLLIVLHFLRCQNTEEENAKFLVVMRKHLENKADTLVKEQQNLIKTANFFC